MPCFKHKSQPFSNSEGATEGNKVFCSVIDSKTYPAPHIYEKSDWAF